MKFTWKLLLPLLQLAALAVSSPALCSACLLERDREREKRKK
jgi:hypothetical protein